MIYVLLRASKRNGKVDTCLTGIALGNMQAWACEHTTRQKITVIIERETGRIAAVYTGGRNGPILEDIKSNAMCEELGIDHNEIKRIKDYRHDL